MSRFQVHRSPLDGVESRFLVAEISRMLISDELQRFVMAELRAAEPPARRDVGASIAVPLAAQDSRSLEYRAGDATQELRCSLLRHCTITFPPGVPLHDYIIADSARWVLDASVAGPEDERLYWIAVKPRLFCGIATLLTVPSSLELTHILLRSPECELEDALGPGDEFRVLAPLPPLHPQEIFYSA